MSDEIKTPYSGTEFSDEAQAAKVAAAAEQKKKYMREAKRKSRVKERAERQAEKARQMEEGRQRAIKLAQESETAQVAKVRREREAFLLTELTPPVVPPPDAAYAIWVQTEIDNFVDDWCGVGADVMKLYHLLSVHPLGRILLTMAGIKPLPELEPPYSYIFTIDGVKVFHKPAGGVSEVWEPYPTPNKSAGPYVQPSTHVNSESIFRTTPQEAEIIAQSRANKYERERVMKREEYRNYLRGVEAKWKAWREASIAAARTVGI